MATDLDRRDSGSAADSQGESVDPLDALLENYQLVFNPELRIKFKQQLPGCSLGLCVAKPWHQGPRFRMTVKPTGTSDRISRSVQKLLIVPTHAQVALFSKKLHLGFFRLQGVAGYNWLKQKPTLDYRITTKWGDGPRLRRKERLDYRDSLQLKAKWNLDFHFPDMEGHLGMEGNGMEALDVDWGRLEFEVSQVDMVLHSPIGRRKEKEAKPGSSASKAALAISEHGSRGRDEGRAADEAWSEQPGPWYQGPVAWVQEFVRSRLQGENAD